MWEFDCEESWVLKNWCFWTVVLEKTLESPLDCKEIQPVHPKGDQFWVFIGRADAEAETPILWPPHAKSWLIGKDPDWEGLGAGGERDDRGWDDWMASLTGWTWVWINSKFLFKSFAYFFQLECLFLINEFWELFIYSGYKSFLRYGICTYCLPVWVYLLSLLKFFKVQKFLIFMNSDLFSPHLWILLLESYIGVFFFFLWHGYLVFPALSDCPYTFVKS